MESESEEHSGDLANAMVDTCTRDCFICPICPERGEQGLDLVVYRDHNALWQHWNAHHSGDEKPPLWKIHLVLGMKLEDTFRRSSELVHRKGQV